MPSMGERRGCSRRTLSKVLRFAPMLLILLRTISQSSARVESTSLLADKKWALEMQIHVPLQHLFLM